MTALASPPAAQPASSRPRRLPAVARGARALAGGVADRSRPFALRAQLLSGSGWAVLLLAVVAITVGLALVWLELVLLGVLAICVLALALPFSLGRPRYRVSLDLGSHRVVAGESAAGALLVESTGRHTQPAGRLELPVGKGHGTVPVPQLEPGGTSDALFSVPTTRRGVIPVGPVRSVRGDPLGLVRRPLRWTDREVVHVHPRTVPVWGSASGMLKDLEGTPTDQLSNDDVSFHALRDYVAGDDRRHIHWRTSARTGVLMVRQFQETRRSHLAIGMIAEADATDTDASAELAISACASIGVQALQEDQTVTVLVQDRTLRTPTPGALLDDLAALDVTTDGGDLASLAVRIDSETPQASLVMLIASGPLTPQEAQRAAQRLPAGIRAVAVACSAGADLARATIGDLVLLTVGRLEDLGPALRQAAR